MDTNNMTWEEYHAMVKPSIKLESVINFETLKGGEKVKINPHNHGFKSPKALDKALTKTYKFIAINRQGIVRVYSPDKNVICYHYQNLLIINQ